MSVTALIAVGIAIGQFLYLYPGIMLVMMETIPILLLTSLVCGAFYLEDRPRAFCIGASIFYGFPCVSLWLHSGPAYQSFSGFRNYFYSAIVYPRYDVADFLILIPGTFITLFYVTCGGYMGLFMHRLGLAQKKRREALERERNQGNLS